VELRNNAAGLVWSFATETTVPVIADQPQDVVVAPGEDAVFELVLRGDLSLLEPVAYRWYDSQGTLLVDGGRIFLSSTLGHPLNRLGHRVVAGRHPFVA